MPAPTSDLDIGVLPSQPLFLAQEQEALFGAALVDLVVLSEADSLSGREHYSRFG